ncbi:MAG: hypothetical protein Q8N88_00010 [Nanoarchaeota archaeon]|nr:hypothetical protein [Nanoarchaeota archaeon]
MENIFISNRKEFEKIKEKFKNDEADKIHVLVDFDRTFTKAFVNGRFVPSLISVLRDENYLTPNYPQKARSLYEKYHAIEIDPTIPNEEKRNFMEEWWNLHFELLIKSGLSKNDIERAMESANLALREGAEKLLEFLKEKGIPLIILSSAGLGKESIELFLSNKNVLFENVHIISNSFRWDENGKAVAVNHPIIHEMNKNETAIKNYPEIYKKIKNRKNIILMGDGLQDADMAEGFEFKNILKIGFLNENAKQNLEAYKKSFNVVIAHDSSMQFVLDLMQDLL